jgi:alkylation response protein AidB-like acyl-CoA dehydrogenase
MTLDGASPAISAAPSRALHQAATDDGIRGFVVPAGTQGFTTQDIHGKLSLRASVTSELLFDDVRLPASAVLPSPENAVRDRGSARAFVRRIARTSLGD